MKPLKKISITLDGDTLQKIKEKAEQDIEYGKARFRSYRNNVSQPVHDSNYNLLYSSGNAYCIYNAVCRQCV